ncbi:MAG: glycoside hydrolase family 1 protein [Spirochaetia bacterium]|nr:glycoside hydrolase family 1 protein [Spirochaetia bacterium]
MTFPRDFLWGTATAAEQIEETPDSNWQAFVSDVLKNNRFESIGPGEAKPGHIRNLGAWSKSVVFRKTNFNEMYTEDLAYAASLGNNAYRFSIAWDKLFPREDMKEPDPAAAAYYDGIFAALKKNHLTPSVTLFHFSTPAWFWREKNGKRGWERDDALDHFERFVRAVSARWGGQVHHWCTLNEPMVFLYAGYMEGVHPPLEKRKRMEDVIPVFTALLKAHATAYKILHEANPSAEVGLTMHTRAFEAYRNYAPLDRILAAKVEQAFIWDLLDALQSGTLRVTNTGYSEEIPGLKGSMDYVGINYYGRHYILSDITSPKQFKVLMADKADLSERINELGWAHYPKGFHDILVETFGRYKKPIYVMENGTADSSSNDYYRQELLVTHIAEMGRAIGEGVPVKGYFHWSLMDNFEWAEGFEARFGLVAIDYEAGFKRTPRPSANVYASIIKDGIGPELYKKYAVLYGEK